METGLRMATADDIDLLIRLRLDFFATEDALKIPRGGQAIIESSLRSYYAKHLNVDFFAALVEEHGKIASTAFLVLYEKPANRAFPTGRTATVLNVFTYPDCRRRGYAMQALRMLVGQARKENASYIELSATKAGRALYKRLGFKETEEALFVHMQLSLL